MSARSSQRSSFNGSPRHLTVEEMNQLSIRSLEELNQLSQATREFGEVYSGSPDASRRSPKFLQRLFDPLESRSDAECLFRVRISGIQCRNLQGRRFSGKSDPFVEFYWDDPEEKAPYATPVIKADLNPNYKGVLIAFEYKATLNALPKRFLWVKVFSNRKFHAKSVIGQTKVDLWSVATGPVHHDHHLIGCDNGRVVFNCYMEQCSEWNISVSDVGVMMPAIANELDRPEGHDFQEDASLPLKKFGVSYKCTIGTNEKFYMGNKLKHAIKREIGDIQEPKGEAGTEDEVAADSLVAQDPMGVQWATSSDYLPPITRYSTFDELMSATLTLEVRQLLVGRGQMSTDPDGGFLSLLEKYKKDTLATPNTDVQFDEEIKNTILFELDFEGASAAAGSKKNLRKSKVVIPVEAQRVLEKMQDLVELMANRQKDDKEGKVRKATKILKMLQVSHKASMLSWVYVSAEALEETKNILLRLWQFLLENIRVRHYTLRNVFYELLFYLVKRAELSDLPLLGFDSTVVTTVLGTKHTHKVSKKDLEFGLKLRAMLVETKFCVLQTVSVRGVMNNNLMFFVARMLSVLCFRLPSFGVELYQLWSESYNEPVPELAAEFRMNADADLFAMDGLEAHLDWRRFHKAIFDEYGEKALRHQEEEAEDKYEVTSEAWKSRFRRLNGEANTLNILLVDQWLCRGFGSGHSTPTSDHKSDGFHLDRTKTRSISEDYVKHPIPPQPKMDSNIQTKFNRLLESIYIAAKKYIDQQSESGNLLRRQTMKATWKKKGMLLKQGFIYKNTWKNKYFSLQNNKLGYGDSEHGPIKREINVIGSVVSEMSNQLDHSQGTRVVLFNCFSVDSGYQKFVLCAPTFEEQREWIEVLTQNATAETAERKDNETLSQLDLAEVAGQLESLAGKNTTNDEVPENLLPYSVLAVKEWLNLRVTAMEIEGKIAAGQPFQMPVLLSKSSLYADDD
ncbi:duf1765 domain containing protein [Phytophthora cinnamomi]|uniref:duf1765 domain containing protein n=1 Tax=Phytophthora cinnamomi TaxID=4785 RepID=UPI00355A3B1C|nr:duf1765 domain containing protein [Phytophthora cinnamomi]